MGLKWTDISFDEYRNFLSLREPELIKAENKLFSGQLEAYKKGSLMILGAGIGNGFELIKSKSYNPVYAFDINSDFLSHIKRDYGNILETIHGDMCDKSELSFLPHCDYVIANLILEFTGYSAFTAAIEAINPKYISCIIYNENFGISSDSSPYTKYDMSIVKVKRRILPDKLRECMREIDYTEVKTSNEAMNSGLLRLDFTKAQ